jgi:hypothetical protein
MMRRRGWEVAHEVTERRLGRLVAEQEASLIGRVRRTEGEVRDRRQGLDLHLPHVSKAIRACRIDWCDLRETGCPHPLAEGLLVVLSGHEEDGTLHDSVLTEERLPSRYTHCQIGQGPGLPRV